METGSSLSILPETETLSPNGVHHKVCSLGDFSLCLPAITKKRALGFSFLLKGMKVGGFVWPLLTGGHIRWLLGFFLECVVPPVVLGALAEILKK